MRSHSSIFKIFGKGAKYTASSKQKLNTKGSTEAELVAIDNAMAQLLWIKPQGNYVPTTTIYQENKCTILLAKNGKVAKEPDN